MSKRKLLYGYQIQNGELTVVKAEAAVVARVASLYLEGLSYQKLADLLNQEHIPFSTEVPVWDKHKVKRLLENPRYTGQNGYPGILDTETFQCVQSRIRRKQRNRHQKRNARFSSCRIAYTVAPAAPRCTEWVARTTGKTRCT